MRNIQSSPPKPTLCDDRHIVLQRFPDKPVLIILGKLPLRGNGGGHAQSDQNHNRHCDDELACSGILAGERNGRSAKAGVRNHVQLISADPGPATGLLTSPDPRQNSQREIAASTGCRRPLIARRPARR
jgi:hypothetical protein